MKKQKLILNKKYFINGIECEIFLVNGENAWLRPTFDDPDDALIGRHIAYAKINVKGKITIL